MTRISTNWDELTSSSTVCIILPMIKHDVIYRIFNSPFAHHNLFSRMHMGVRNDPSLGPVFSDSFSSTKKLKIHAVSIMFFQPCTCNS